MVLESGPLVAQLENANLTVVHDGCHACGLGDGSFGFGVEAGRYGVFSACGGSRSEGVGKVCRGTLVGRIDQCAQTAHMRGGELPERPLGWVVRVVVLNRTGQLRRDQGEAFMALSAHLVEGA